MSPDVLCLSASLSIEHDPCEPQIPPGLLERTLLLQWFLVWILVSKLPLPFPVPTHSHPNLI